MERTIVNTGEFYKWDYQSLVSELGTEKALQKVAMYQSQPYANIPCVKNGRLLQSFIGFVSKSIPSYTIPVAPPHLTEEEFKDPTDKGISHLPNTRKLIFWQRKQQAARRAKQYDKY